MSSVLRKVMPDNEGIVLPAPASVAIEIGDLMYWDDSANKVKPASSQIDQLTEAANQAAFRANFVGVARQARLAADAVAGDITLDTDGVFEFPCPSTTWEIGDMVGASEAASGTALEDQQVEKVTSGSLAIGVCVRRTSGAVTTVRCRLISSWVHDLAHLQKTAVAGELVGGNGNGATNANLLNANFNGNDGPTAYTVNDLVATLKKRGVIPR